MIPEEKISDIHSLLDFLPLSEESRKNSKRVIDETYKGINECLRRGDETQAWAAIHHINKEIMKVASKCIKVLCEEKPEDGKELIIKMIYYLNERKIDAKYNNSKLGEFSDLEEMALEYLLLEKERYLNKKELGVTEIDINEHSRTSNEKLLFSEYLLSDLHQLTNNVQFHNISINDFKAIINKPKNNTLLKIKRGESLRVYHLLDRLRKTIKDTDQSSKWLNELLIVFNTKETTFKSKYSDVGSDDLNEKNISFRETISEIFQKHEH